MNDKEFDDCPEGFYTTLEHEVKEVHHSDAGFDELDANFVGIESLCGKYGSPFSSKSQLHKHLKEDCTGSVQIALPTSPAPVSPIPIIESKAIVPVMGSGLAFRG